MAEDQEGWTIILQAASGFGWLATAFGTWLLLPAWWHIIQEKPRNFSWKVFQYFCWWLAGDFLHLTALLLEGAGLHQWILYVIIAAFETGILITLALYAHVFYFIKWPRPWQSKLSDEVKNKPHAAHIGAAGFMFSVLPEEDMTPKRKLFGIDRKLAHNLLGTAFFIACAVAVWLVVAVLQLTNLPVPHPSIWPNDAKTRVAYVFAWIGFCCWVWPRIWVIYKREDDIDTSSVVIGLGAHFCNMANIAVLNFRGSDSAWAQLPFFATSFICSGLDIARLILKKKNDKTILHAYKEKNYLQKDAKYQSEKEKNLRKEQGKIDSKRRKHKVEPVFPKKGRSPYDPRYHSDLTDGDSPHPASYHPPRPNTDAAQLVLDFGLPLDSKQRRRLQLDMARKPGEARPELQERAQEAMRELKARESKLYDRLEELLEDEWIWNDGTEEIKKDKGNKLDITWKMLCQELKWNPEHGERQVPKPQDQDPEPSKHELQETFGTIDYQALQTLRMVKFAFGNDDGRVKALREETKEREYDWASLRVQIVKRRRFRHGSNHSRSPIAFPPRRLSSSHPLQRASSAPPLASSTPVDSANHSPDTPTAPSHPSYSINHRQRQRQSFDSDSSFSSSESDSERSVDEEELLARNRYSRSKGGRRYVERW